ncbi:Sensor histidine kinase [Halomicronema hongdechloris C2206]|uniref:histidine kinase n=1 Tax=Halomicronema hongdechloris C2206 TaxID=1641165 RepID=A0A1Z3HIM4_9CYAN|nr:ATP-binding protein [Halomicronema hongdechloris]ASC70169.1 Sensor histidine kinase [Halomicronema hongdechloris C2206]
MPPANPALAALLHRMIDRIRQSLELSEMLSTTVNEVQAFLKTDRVKVYRFEPDGSGEVIAESIRANRLPSLLGHRFPAEDIPQEARELFLLTRQRNIVNVAKGEIGISPLVSPKTQQQQAPEIWVRQVDPCHVEYLTNMGVQSSLVVPILYQQTLWGLLVAHHSKPKSVSPRALEVLQLVADQVSIALNHAMLLSQSRLRAHHEAAINKVVALLHKAPANSLQAALDHTVKTLNGIGGRLYLNGQPITTPERVITTGVQPVPRQLPAQHQPSSPHANQSSGEASMAPPVLEELLAWRAWLRNEPPAKPGELLWAVDNLSQSQVSPLLTLALTPQNIGGLLIAQLTHRHQHLGYLSIFRATLDQEIMWAGRLDSMDPRQRRPRQSFETWRELKRGQSQPWTEQEIELALTLSHHFSQAIYQSRLYHQIQSLNTELEARVGQRTIELKQANDNLKQEIEEREKTLLQLQSARDSLKRLSHQHELLLKSAGEGICGLDSRGRITFANPAAAKTLGYTMDSIQNRFIHQLVELQKADGTPYTWEDSPIFKTLIVGTTEYKVGDLFRRHQGEHFPVEYISTPIQEKGNILGAVVIFKDITERQMVERLKDEFISVVSHELRTPLTSIRTALGLLVQDNFKVAPSKQRRMIEIAFSNTNRLVRLVNDILDIERIKLGKVVLRKQICNLADLMNQAVDEMQAMADEHSIELIVSCLAIDIWVDPDRIVQTLANLLSNAIKFSPKGSTVNLTASFSDSETILIAVKDEGAGIPEDKLETIFAQFEQLNVVDDEYRGGTGLGLAICRSIIEQHGGSIWAESILNQGSTFFFTLPFVSEPEPPSQN